MLHAYTGQQNNVNNVSGQNQNQSLVQNGHVQNVYQMEQEPGQIFYLKREG